MRPLFFEFPADQRTYALDDEWMLGPAVLAAPVVRTGVARDVYLPAGTWYDVDRGRAVDGPRLLTGYAAPLGTAPVFVRLGARGASEALRALRE